MDCALTAALYTAKVIVPKQLIVLSTIPIGESLKMAW